jgi:hypothetical protein
MADIAAVQTTVQQTQVDDLSDLFSQGPSAAQVVTAAEKPNIFSKEGVDVSFLDAKQERGVVGENTNNGRTGNKEQLKEEGEEENSGTRNKEQLNAEGEGRNNRTGNKEQLNAEGESEESIDALLRPETEEEGAEEGIRKGGRPKTDKSGLVDFFKKQIEGGRLFAFDDFDDSKESLEDYLERLSPKDFDELWDANHQELGKHSQHQVSKQFFESLPTELQYAYKYVADGGQDLKGLFQALSQVEEVRSLEVEKESDQEEIYRQYLRAINFGSPEEIEEDITTWKDLGQLDKKAKQVKPKLDKMQEQIVTQRLQQQEQLRQQEEAAAQAYVEHVYHALEPGEINGLRLDKKTQSFLYNSMVSAQYPSITGKPTNLLGHLLEKYQFVEPNYGLITEALWLLSDPDGYRQTVKQSGANEAIQKTVRTLKTEESRKVGSAAVMQDAPTTRQRKIAKPGNIFKRA